MGAARKFLVGLLQAFLQTTSKTSLGCSRHEELDREFVIRLSVDSKSSVSLCLHFSRLVAYKLYVSCAALDEVSVSFRSSSGSPKALTFLRKEAGMRSKETLALAVIILPSYSRTLVMMY